MIDPDRFMPIQFIKKEPLTGSYKGMRYRMIRSGQAEEPALLAAIWPEPFCFEKTDEDKKQFCEFAFSEQGLMEAVAWLNGQYQEQKDVWDKANIMQFE